MNWKDHLESLENKKEWFEAIKLVQKVLMNEPCEKEVYIRGIYLLLNLLLEEEYPVDKHDVLASLLKNYFEESYAKYSGDAEYLFFIGYFIELGDWYFGEDKLRLADEMTKKALSLEPTNILYKWSLSFSKNDPVVGELSRKILTDDKSVISWLKSKGAPGQYILNVINNCNKKNNSVDYRCE